MLIALGTFSVVQAQEKKLKREQLPPAVEKTVATESQGATIKGFATEVENGKRLYEVAMTVDGRSKDISMDRSGKVVEVEQEVTMASLPATVQEGLRKAAGAGTIGMIESLTKGGKLVPVLLCPHMNRLILITIFLIVRGIFIVLLFVLPGSYKVCGAQERAFDDAEMTRYITAEMRAFNIPGAAVGIVHNGRIEYLRGFGPADDGGRPITPQTPFLIGSNSKSFTALGVMQLVESGRVDLDKPVQEYLPWFRLKDVEASKKITVRQLLNQTSGLYDSTTPFDEYVAKLGEVRLARPPDQGYEYSDHNYEILGILIEQLSHESYAAYMRDHVLSPLEMRSTYVTYDDAVTNGLAGGHQYLFGLTVSAATSRYAPHDVPAGYIATSAEDMCHYLIAQQNGGVYRGASVVSPASLAVMHRPRTDVDSDYGMGWFIESWNGHESINHMGMNANFSSMMNLLPEKGYGVVILTDVNSFSVLGKTNLMDGVIRRINGQERIRYWPEELLVRLLLLIALLIGFAELLHRLWQLRKFRYLSLPRLSTKVALPLVFGVALVMVLLVAIPYYADATLEDMFELQPDMGYGLVSLAILCLVDSLINAAVRSRAVVCVDRRDSLSDP